MSSPIVCDLKNVTPEELFKKLIRKDTDGNPAVNVVIVEGDGDPFIDCTNNQAYNWERLVKEMITVDTDGNYALKVIESTEA